MKKICKTILLALFACTFLVSTTYADLTKNGFGWFRTEGEKKAVIVGDSYTNCFREFIGMENYDYVLFNPGGLDNLENRDRFLSAINDSKYNFVFFLTGVNDIANNVTPPNFTSYVQSMATKCKELNKILFVTSYMDFPLRKTFNYIFKIQDYDAALRLVASVNANVIYIDMKEFENEIYSQGDKVHYGNTYYTALRDKLEIFIDNINGLRKAFNVREI